MKKTFSFLLFFSLFLFPTLVLAGPGGAIAKVVVKSFWGRVGLLIFAIIFAPLIIYIYAKEHRAKKRVLRELQIVAKKNPDFAWLKLRERLQDCFLRVHSAWEKSDVSEASDWMTDWYWQNQQMVFLDQWERDGLKNICEVSRAGKIQPLLFKFEAEGGVIGEGSVLAVLITADMTDYLVRLSDGKLMEGTRDKREVARIWSFIYENGKWVVSYIEEDDELYEYIDLMKEYPELKENLDQYTEPQPHYWC